MDLRQIRAFVAVADHLSFRRAAERLCIAQPALSRQVRQLEESLKTRLFERDRRSVALTVAGVAVLEQARTLLATVNGLPLLAQRAALGESGQLRVGFISLVAYEYLPALVREFRSALPDADVAVHEFPVMQQFEPLLRDRFDVLILRPLQANPVITTLIIGRPRFVVALPKGHALCSCRTLRLVDLAREALISLPDSDGPSFQSQVLGLCRAAGFRPAVIREVGDSQAMVGMVGAGMGVAIVPESVRHLRTDGVEYRYLADLTERADIVVAWNRVHRNPLVAEFVRAAARAFPMVEPRRDADAALASQHVQKGIGAAAAR